MIFYRIAHPTIQSGLVIRYKEIGPRGGLQISASRDGIRIGGFTGVHSSAQDFIDVLQRAEHWVKAIRGGATMSDVESAGLNEEPYCVGEIRRAHFAADDEVIERRGG